MRVTHYIVVVLASLLVMSIVSFGQQTPSCTIFVNQGESIQAAIDRAKEGDMICLAAGTWRENFKIDKSLTLQGTGAEKTIIEGEKDGYPVGWITSEEEILVKLEGLKLTGAKGGCVDSPTICAHGLLVQGKAKVEIKDSTISGNMDGIGLWDSARATVSGSTISGNREAGIWLNDSSQATIAGSTISDNKGNGIELWDSAQATISGNLLQDNGNCGISSWSIGEVRGEGNRMVNNGNDLCGNLPGTLRLPLREPTEARITWPDGRYSSLQEAVDALLPGGELIIQAGEFTAGVTITKKVKIKAAAGSQPTLRGKSKDAAVLSVVGGGELELEGLKLTGGRFGLFLGADARATISDSTFSKNKYAGIGLEGSSQATISDSTFSKNKYAGIWLKDSSQATISDSTFSKNKYAGIGLVGFSQAIISGSSFSGNGAGIELEDSSQAIISDSTISENQEDGIWLEGSSQASISGSSFSGNGAGIGLLDFAQATISDSTFSRNLYGIRLWDSSQATISSSTFSGSLDGIELEDSSQATILGSSFSKNGSGIGLWDSSQATIKGNEIINNGGYGVEFWQRPCFNTDKVFAGRVSGKGNTISGNGEADVCPSDLSFLMTAEGGELDRRK